MTTSIVSAADGLSANIQLNGVTKAVIGALGIEQGAPAGFRNKLINGEVTRINQRAVANWAAVADGAYGYDRWKKIDASNMTQIIESGNFKVSTVHTLSGTGVTTQQITSPASGHWTLPAIPITATNVQLEEGSIATAFEQRPIGAELALCQRYYEIGKTVVANSYPTGSSGAQSAGQICFKMSKRVTPTMAQFGTSVSGNVSANSFTATTTETSGILMTIGAAIGVYSCTIDWLASAEL